MTKQLSEDKLYLFNEGKYYNAYEMLGSHFENGGTRFNVWVPGARSVFVVGEFSNWEEWSEYRLQPVGNSGIWTCFVNDLKPGAKYKYSITSKAGKRLPLKADPYAVYSEVRPNTASIVHEFNYKWKDDAWIAKREKTNHFKSPKNIYEVHLGSWKRNPLPENATELEKDNNFYTYTQLADELIPYVKNMGYTHIEIMPVMEHPFDGSWGYQTTGYFAATSRYGKPEELMYLIDKAHRANIGIILDWAAGHFCLDDFGLAKFNGEMLYENEVHPNWGTGKFDFGRPEVRSFLLSNAMFWIKQYHADGIRVDGVSSMLYLNFGVDDPKKKKFNKYGDEGNLEAISFCKELSEVIGKYCPGVMLIAEESTAWPLVTKPPEVNGLGFHYKWDMGWMHDTLNYMKADFPYREGCHNMLTFSMMYAYAENYILPFSHDEVVHGKASIIGRMPGDTWRQFAGLRALAMYQMTHTGAKLNFMGNEIAQFIEWRYYEGLEFFLTEKFENHKRHQDFIKDLNHVYKKEKELWQDDNDPAGFEWIDANDSKQSVYSYLRKTAKGRTRQICVIHFGVFEYEKYRVGVPGPGYYQEIINSDDKKYGGNGHTNPSIIKAEKIPAHGRPYSIAINIPSLGGMILKKVNKK
jgi:1,4-alpha-glucan branching enzyme